MKKLEFLIERGLIMARHDAAIVSDGDDLTEELSRSVVDSLSTEIHVRIGGVTMFLAAWQDPHHWSEDWAEKLGVDSNDAPDAVWALLTNAITEEPA